MSTTGIPVSTGQIRYDPELDSFVVVGEVKFNDDHLFGWTVQGVDRSYRHHVGPARWVWNQTITRWPLINPTTITEPQ